MATGDRLFSDDVVRDVGQQNRRCHGHVLVLHWFKVSEWVVWLVNMVKVIGLR